MNAPSGDSEAREVANALALGKFCGAMTVRAGHC